MFSYINVSLKFSFFMCSAAQFISQKQLLCSQKPIPHLIHLRLRLLQPSVAGEVRGRSWRAPLALRGPRSSWSTCCLWSRPADREHTWGVMRKVTDLQEKEQSMTEKFRSAFTWALHLSRSLCGFLLHSKLSLTFANISHHKTLQSE